MLYWALLSIKLGAHGIKQTTKPVVKSFLKTQYNMAATKLGGLNKSLRMLCSAFFACFQAEKRAQNTGRIGNCSVTDVL
jgi:hypothetical protein